MYGAGINQVGKCHLVNMAQSLKIRMAKDPPDQGIIDGDKPIYGIVDDFTHWRHREKLVK